MTIDLDSDEIDRLLCWFDTKDLWAGNDRETELDGELHEKLLHAQKVIKDREGLQALMKDRVKERYGW